MFAIDDASVAASIRSKTFQLQELSITPRLTKDRPIHNVWTKKIAGTDIVLMNPSQRKNEGERTYRRALAISVNANFGAERQAIREAAKLGHGLINVRLCWNRISQFIRGPGDEAAIWNDLGVVLNFLAQVEVYVAAVREQRPADQQELQQRLEALMASRNGLHWATATPTVSTSIETSVRSDRPVPWLSKTKIRVSRRWKHLS
ncbi:hypothetical protein [Devosia psychrophila]|uniref:Uncharacterized protein n=1 Tax=Devosia psychrophila TaxID=728005 RepID=A0A0F5Q102_9HYPH|nr:hypothetical protein [Devosia psychrophila]KKC34568.1 hypothetical protein WH91_02240 [Devosia psychrophila]SFD34953.1 hypothetical protein SAMN04488059_1442 [Devosia psychrophila]